MKPWQRMTMTPEEINDKYKDRIFKILSSIKSSCEEAGLFVSTPSDFSDDDYRYQLMVTESPDDEEYDKGVDVTFIIAESENWDGEENGINFMVDIVSYEGQIIGGLCPYNYTQDVWVSRDDEDAIEQRFQLMEQADESDVSYLISDFYNRQ
jgi:hypothetical protein